MLFQPHHSRKGTGLQLPLPTLQLGWLPKCRGGQSFGNSLEPGDSPGRTQLDREGRHRQGWKHCEGPHGTRLTDVEEQAPSDRLGWGALGRNSSRIPRSPDGKGLRHSSRGRREYRYRRLRTANPGVPGLSFGLIKVFSQSLIQYRIRSGICTIPNLDSRIIRLSCAHGAIIEFGAKYLKDQIYWAVHMGPISVSIYNTTFSNYLF